VYYASNNYFAKLLQAKKIATIIKKYPETVEKFHPEILRPITSLEGKGPLKERDAMGCQVLVLRISKSNFLMLQHFSADSDFKIST